MSYVIRDDGCAVPVYVANKTEVTFWTQDLRKAQRYPTRWEAVTKADTCGGVVRRLVRRKPSPAPKEPTMPNDLPAKLKTIWAKYEPQRTAERDIAARNERARKALAAFNAERAKEGLGLVTEWQPQHVGLGHTTYSLSGPQPKTWRDELDAELLAAVKGWLGS